MLDFGRFTHLSFDCYGTLVNWERGILAALRPILDRHGIELTDAELIDRYAKWESEKEAGSYRTYREILSDVTAAIGGELGLELSPSERDALADSVGTWMPFEDTVAALAKLEARFRLVILSNIDDAMFAETRERLGCDFAEVVTAERVQSYKPASAHFDRALELLSIDRGQMLHVAQSLYHDHAPAKKMGFTTVWVNRASSIPGRGVAPAVEVVPDLEVPDLASLAALATGG